MSDLGYVGTVTETGREAGVYSFEWEIPGFLSLAAEEGDRYTSPLFDAYGGRWMFTIFPNGMWGSAGGYCELLLCRYDKGARKTFSCTAGIRCVHGVQNRKKIMQEMSYGGLCSWLQFCSRDELRKEGMLNEGALIVTLEVTTEEPKDASFQNTESARGAPIEEIKSSEKKGIEKLGEDIGKLLVSGENCDVTVQVGDVEFKAHRLILSARCPVLSAMLMHETAERVSGKITVRDCEPDVFGDFLHYIYHGSVQHLSEKNVFDLYCVADQYLAEDLKQECLEYIRNTLSVQTFCDTMRLALRHGQRDLLERAVEFASQNIRSIIRTVEWQQFLRDCPTEANEIFIKSLGPPCKKLKI